MFPLIFAVNVRRNLLVCKNISRNQFTRESKNGIEKRHFCREFKGLI